jgi:hypothetical protein
MSIIDHTDQQIQYNQPSFSPTSLLSHLIFTFIILSRIEFILPIQSRGRKINRTYSTFFLFTNLRSIACLHILLFLVI